MKYSVILISFFFVLLLGCKSDTSREQVVQERPNIVFIMTDDHAKAAVSAYGSELLQTPNIDRLAREGMLFTNSFVTNSICAPSRATILTGKFSHLNGKKDNEDIFDGTQVTFPKLLQAAGYSTAMIGKWHLRSEPRGFDFYSILEGQGDYYAPEFITKGDTTVMEGYVTDVITDIALGYLDTLDHNKPFCLMYHHKAPHRNWMPNLKDLSLFKEDTLPVPENFFDDYQGRQAAEEAEMRIAEMWLSMDLKMLPHQYEVEDGKGGSDNFDAERDYQRNYNRLTPEQKEVWDAHYGPVNDQYKKYNLKGKDLALWKYQRYIKDYLRCVKSVDDNIGRLLAYLDKNDLAENTIVVYTSDQGFYLGEHGWFDKRFMYEESLGMPLIVRYPNAVRAGLVNDQLVQNLDFAPTFLDFAGVDIPGEMQGESMKGLLSGQENQSWRDGVYYHYYEYPHGWHKVKRHYGIRTHQYKLIHFYHDIDTWELYDLENDPSELNNLYDHPEYADIREGLHRKLEELRTHYRDTGP